MATATPTLSPDPDPYSVVVEAERVARLESARLLFAGSYYDLPRRRLEAESAVVARELDATASCLAREGWVQGASRSEFGWCLLSAVERAVAPAAVFSSTAYRLLVLMVHVRTGVQESAVAAWNDGSRRTLAEVLELVEDGAVFARSWTAVS